MDSAPISTPSLTQLVFFKNRGHEFGKEWREVYGGVWTMKKEGEGRYILIKL